MKSGVKKMSDTHTCTVDLGFKVCFYLGLFPVDNIETWVHEFSEMSILDLLEEDHGVYIYVIDFPSGASTMIWFRIPHIMLALHTSSSLLYPDGIRIVFNPDEFAFQILGWKGLARRMSVNV